jgi:hypothetical protein
MTAPVRVPPLAPFALLALARPSEPAVQAPDVAPARSAPGVQASAPPIDAALRAHATPVADYTLRATLDPVAHMVHGQGTLRWTNTSTATVRELWLHLYLNGFKNERSVFLRERVGGRGSAPIEDWGWIDMRALALREADGTAIDLLGALETKRGGDEDETEARLPLPREVAPGQSISLELAFDDKLPVVIERTGYRGSFHMVGQWFPKIARLEPDGTWEHFPFHHLAEFYADFGTYDVTLDVPESFTIGATGPVVETRVQNGRRIERHVQGDVHDFAWTAWDRWQTLRERIAGVDVSVLYPPGFQAVAERDLATIRFALPYQSARYGAYPYPVLTVVHPQQDAAEAGGMEYPTLITTIGAWWTPRGVRTPEIVTVHELGHQWFYGVVATNEAKWPVLDEGLNQFAEGDAMAKWKGPSSAVDLLGLSVSDAAAEAVFSARAATDEPIAQPAYEFSSGASYARLVYGRTATVFATLARVYGDEAVGEALGRYTRRYRFEHPGPEEMLGVVAEVMGQTPAATLRTALFDKGWVDFAVDGVWSDESRTSAGVFDGESGRHTVSGKQDGSWEGSVLVRRRGTLVFPVDVDLVLSDGSRKREHWDGMGSSRRFYWRGPQELRGAIVDPEDRVLVDANLENNHGAAVRGREGAPRSLERAVYWVQLALQAISP